MKEYIAVSLRPKEKNSYYVHVTTKEEDRTTSEVLFQRLPRDRANRIARELNRAYADGRRSVIGSLYWMLGEIYNKITGEDFE